MERKVVMITGATKGIGKAAVEKFTTLPYDLVIHYRSDKETAEKLCDAVRAQGKKAMAVYADMSSLKDVNAMFDQVFEQLGSVDILINNAGTSSEVYFVDATEKDFDYVNGVDFKALFFATQRVVKRLIALKKPGLIINLSSNQVEGCWPRATIYASVKAAVSKFTKNASMELAPYGIRLVAVAPGYTDIGWAADSHLRKAEKYLPLKRFAKPEEIAEGIAYLASDAASYITGSTLTIDGGATLPVVACNDFVDLE